MKKRPLPQNFESEFGLHELFFSRTDRRGVITQGNAVFVRVSGYSEDELVGSAHNIVRHPDMPKAVFQFFWEVLKADQPMVAYVKNLSADGGYYWVLAAAFPTNDGYVSIRLKPTTQYFNLVKGLYSRMLEIEKKQGVEAAYNTLFEQVKALGFSSYRAFSQAALVLELQTRDETLRKSDFYVKSRSPFPVGSSARLFGDVASECSRALHEYDAIYERLHILDGLKEGLEKASSAMQEMSKSVKYISLNMSVESERTGAGGRSLSVISETFRNWSDEVSHALESFRKVAHLIATKLESLEFDISASRLQIELLRFYSQELIQESEGVASDLNQKSDSTHELKSFLGMAVSALSSATEELLDIQKRIESLDSEMDLLKEAVRALYIVHQSGRVEAARVLSESGAFSTHLTNMGQFLDTVRTELGVIEKSTLGLKSELVRLRQSMTAMRQGLTSVLPRGDRDLVA